MDESPRDGASPNPWLTGDEDAARQLFDRYAEQLVALARRRISQRLASRIDPEDIVQSVFRTFFHRAKQGQFHLEEPDDVGVAVCSLVVSLGRVPRAVKGVERHADLQLRNRVQID